MKNILFVLTTLLSFSILSQGKNKNLESEMKRLKIETVLIVQSQAIDEHPLWSPNSDFVACNIAGKWYKFRLTNIKLGKAKWHDKKIGFLTTEDAYSALTPSEQLEFDKDSVFNIREATTSNGTRLELKMDEMTVSMVVTKPGEEPTIIWTSGGENCYGLVISPDEKYVAYLCEMNGLFIMKL